MEDGISCGSFSIESFGISGVKPSDLTNRWCDILYSVRNEKTNYLKTAL
jgi:hypothetical protein